MQPIENAWCFQIDVTNYCTQRCLYCSRYNRHLRPDQRVHMSYEMFEAALESLQDWPGKIGIIGGEPLLHPQFREFNRLLRQRFPRNKCGLWTSGLPKTYLEDPRVDPDIIVTYGFIAYNPHDMEQIKKCRHQPLTVAIGEVVADTSVREQLISNCWVQRTWCPSITHKGGYFCEVAAAQDILLNDGANALPIEKDWWKLTPECAPFKKQRDTLCNNCGMAIPMERELILEQREKFTPQLLQRFRNNNLKFTGDDATELFGCSFTKEELKTNILHWYPGNYREDLREDELALEGRGFVGELM